MSSKLPTNFQQFIHLSRYAKWIDGEGRRETWTETVDRYLGYMFDTQCKGKVDKDVREEIRQAILNLEVMPSMRCMMTAGPALARDNVAAFNCSAAAIDDISVFSEAIYLSMCGCGFGFSVERQFIAKLPVVADKLRISKTVIKVEDSRIGWANAFRELMSMLYQGRIPEWDVSEVRPAGSKLKTFGGRASGPQPLVDLFKFTIETFKQAEGRKLSSIECHDIMCKVGEIVCCGGVRRSSFISLSNPSDDRMRHAKSGNWFDLTPWRSMANNSSSYTEKPGMDVFMREWLSLYDSKSGERGIFNREAAKKHLAKMGRRDINHDFIVNPCITGETKVAVADGRNSVPIVELANEGKDVPVYCISDKGEIVIRTMRNPRITGIKEPIFKVLLDDGSSVRTTGNHKFLLSDGSYREVKDLQSGDSLKIMTKYSSSLKWLLDRDDRFSDYWWINFNRRNQAEHRYIAEWMTGRKLHTGEVVHHKNKNGKDNSFANLVVMDAQDHDNLHRDNMMGENNPMVRARTEWDNEKWTKYKSNMSKTMSGSGNARYSGFSHDQIKKHAISLTQKLGRRFSNNDWREYAEERGLPQNFSKWRKLEFGSISNLAKWAVIHEGMEVLGATENKHYMDALEQGYNAVVINGRVFVKKTCEYCGKTFEKSWRRREISFCNVSCSSKHVSDLMRGTNRTSGGKDSEEVRMKIRNSMLKFLENHKQEVRQKQMLEFTVLKFSLNREPDKSEWVLSCKQHGISPEISRKSSPFRYWEDLKNNAALCNHRVVSIVRDGEETVYNGTVDEFHNFFVGGFEGKTKDGKDKLVYLNNMNCGEVLIRPTGGTCNLTEVVVRPEDTIKTLMRKVKLATILGTMQATLTDFRYLRPIWKKNAEEEALIGVSLTGVMDNELMSGSKGKKELGDALTELRESVIKVNKEWSAKLGINQATATTTNKPSGTVSALVGSASGIHSRYSKYYIRRVRMDKKDPLSAMMIAQGFPYEEDSYKPEHQWVFSFPMKSPDNAVTAEELSALDQLEIWKTYQSHWAEHSVSCTVYVRENEWMEVGAWVYRNFDQIRGVSFLPYSGHNYKQAPFESISEAEYETALKTMPKNVDWNKLKEYEKDDTTTSSHEVACSGDSCEIK